MSTWQPIATAPKDGTYILAYCPAGRDAPNQGINIVFWSGSAWKDPATYMEYVDEHTHWMPIPKGPE
jgi:hypothetical protein